MEKKIKMKFIGGKQAPGNMDTKPLKVGDVYELPISYAQEPWWTPVDPKAIVVPPAPAPTPQESALKPPSEAEEAFEEHLASTLPSDVEPIMSAEEKQPAAEATVPLDEQRKKFESMTKADLVAFIQTKNGVANESMLKAVLVETALNLASKSS